MIHVNKRRAGKHDRLEKQQADPPTLSRAVFDDLQELVDFNQWHVGVDEFEVGA
jgi:hypothetical protein